MLELPLSDSWTSIKSIQIYNKSFSCEESVTITLPNKAINRFYTDYIKTSYYSTNKC